MRPYKCDKIRIQYQNNNTNERSARLLNNIPSLELVHPSSIYRNDRYFEEDFEKPADDNDKCPPQIRKFLLKFLRGGNHNVESATTLLLAYLQMMKDHPKYYDGFINPGSFLTFDYVPFVQLFSFLMPNYNNLN